MKHLQTIELPEDAIIRNIGMQHNRICKQGFIDQKGNFLTRKETLILANKNGQKIYSCGSDSSMLFSDNLY